MFRSFVVLTAAVSLQIGLFGCAASSPQATSNPSPPPTLDISDAAIAAQRRYSTPEAAVDALVQAAKANDAAELKAAFGTDALNDSGDPALDRLAREEFAERAAEKRRLLAVNENQMELVVGRNNWPFPVPLVRETDGRWRWDTRAGADELLSRRIGRNELAAIELCNAYVAAQAEYSRLDRDADEVLEYAQRVMSTPGTRDGLYWERRSDDDLQSPLDLLARFAEELFPDRVEGDPLMGYHFKILARQGSNAPGGKYDYVINGNMIAGFAMVAWPAEYGNSGIMTFVVSHQGRVLQCDLGERTSAIASAMKAYDPNESWTEVE